MKRGGFRYDNKMLSGGELMVQGELYSGNAGQFISAPSLTTPFTETFSNDASLNGQFILGRWSSSKEGDTQTSIQTYFDRAVRREYHANVETNIFDIEVERRQRFGKIHDVIAGIGYRFNRDDIGNSTEVAILSLIHI